MLDVFGCFYLIFIRMAKNRKKSFGTFFYEFLFKKIRETYKKPKIDIFTCGFFQPSNVISNVTWRQSNSLIDVYNNYLRVTVLVTFDLFDLLVISKTVAYTSCAKY